MNSKHFEQIHREASPGPKASLLAFGFFALCLGNPVAMPPNLELQQTVLEATRRQGESHRLEQRNHVVPWICVVSGRENGWFHRSHEVHMLDSLPIHGYLYFAFMEHVVYIVRLAYLHVQDWTCPYGRVQAIVRAMLWVLNSLSKLLTRCSHQDDVVHLMQYL